MIREEYQQYYIAPEGTHLMPGATSDESGITMTDEDYEKLMVLLNSDDRENVEMGIELADSLGFSLPPTEIPDNEEYEEFFVPSNDAIANSDIVYEWIYDRVYRAPLLDKHGHVVSQYETLSHKWTRVLEHLFNLVRYQSHDWVDGPRGLYKQDNENAGMNKEYYQEAALIVDKITERFVNAKFRAFKVPIRIDPDKPAGSLPRSNKSLSRELKSILRALAQKLPRGMAALAWLVKNREYTHQGDRYPRDRKGETIADRKAAVYNLTLPSRSEYMQDTWPDKIVDAYRRAKAFLTRNHVPTSTTTMSDKTWKDLPKEK